MPQLTWQKSSFSGGGEGECVELAAAASRRIHLRESDRPHAIATTTPHTLAGLLGALKTGRIARP
ncbi:MULTISPECIES: DUF397 domain-containing protein [unclassified Streptomyces]|uniref:DUF397 domain-containing protein n=1 Tax=unclassified Streptomyces TaxID=2593676 RepID=UPI002E82080F|nr:DUF397 domain-containing protein [Streptomyces sp. NBC_00589]WTI38996.1 DUF397 domain-containing protein [Streptomyces sp. NBC_00775]WUB27324.1 DUF397 domain-containing protein [Streptomyces sp. NBC_00589]